MLPTAHAGAALSADEEFAAFRRSVRELTVAQHTEILIPQ
jgi:hypothetical protein